MTDWFYFDDLGRKRGPYSRRQILELGKQKVINANTMLENPDGQIAPARELLRKPPADVSTSQPVKPNPFTAAPPSEPSPFADATPAGPSPFTGSASPTGFSAPDTKEQKNRGPKAEKKKKVKKVKTEGEGRFSLAVLAVGIVGLVIIGTLIYALRDDLFGGSSSAPPSGNQIVVDKPTTDDPAIPSPPLPPGPPDTPDRWSPGTPNRVDRSGTGGSSGTGTGQQGASSGTTGTQVSNDTSFDDFMDEINREQIAEAAQKAEEARIAAEKERADREAAIATAVSIVDEIAARGFGSLSDDRQLNGLTQYGTQALRSKLRTAISNHSRRSTPEGKVEAQKTIDETNEEIEAELAEVAGKSFFGVFPFHSGNGPERRAREFVVTGNAFGNSDFPITIPTEFTNTQSDRVEISFPGMSGINAEFVPASRQSGYVVLSLSGNTGGIRELLYNSDAYRAKVWFDDVRAATVIHQRDGEIVPAGNSARVLKIEIINAPPRGR